MPLAESPFQKETLLFEPVATEDTALSVIFAFPNEYSVGITSLGYQVVWATLAARPDVHVSRLFTDCQEALPAQPDVLGFSVSWELDYVNILTLLEQLNMPLRTEQRQ
ncbi:MAG: radical SAM protein, partial [Leptolyngbyaceae cyanobacterium SM2_3_12]|nr:radical SAM protein [Leptolyngbyaceae cyanobacterium SM2_3_12]